MREEFSVQRILALRKLTRSVSELLRVELKSHLATLAPLFRPQTVLGEYVQSHAKGVVVSGAERAFKELQEEYEGIAGAAPFNFPRELKAPLEVLSSSLEITPFEYLHDATDGAQAKSVTVTSPLKWAINYAGFGPGRLAELLADRDRPDDELRQFLVHNMILALVMRRQPGVVAILEGLHFGVETSHPSEYGGVPITFVSSSVSTVLPQDGVVIESTEISGTSAFEEVVDPASIDRLRHPLRERLARVLAEHGELTTAG